jgi:hypothetical protein
MPPERSEKNNTHSWGDSPKKIKQSGNISCKTQFF